MNMKLTDIRIDLDTQSRAEISEATVADYAEAIEAGAKLPPVVVFTNGVQHILGDGFHRYLAHKRVGCTEIEADVRAGTLADAQLFAYAANQAHGLRRTNADKQKSVAGVLALRPEWSDRAIARHVGVSDRMVNGIRGASAKDSQMQTRTVERNGKTYEQDVTGQKKAAAERTEKTIVEELQAESSTGLPASVPPAIQAQREPGPVTTTAGEDEDLGPSVDEILAEVQRDLQAAQAQVTALASTDTGAQLLSAIQRAEHAERRRDEAMTDSARAKGRADRYERTLQRIGKAVGEKDLDKVAPAVEAMARKVKADA